MREPQLNAIASNGVGGPFYWRFGCGPDYIEEAVEALMKAIDRPQRLPGNPYADRMTRAEFRGRINKAEQGKLRPPDEIGPVREGIPEVRLFEIRWPGVRVLERDPVDGSPSARHELRVEVRLYYAEPPQFGQIILGLHCHEKSVKGSKDDVRNAQDAEIDQAIRCYVEGMPRRWCIEELAV